MNGKPKHVGELVPEAPGEPSKGDLSEMLYGRPIDDEAESNSRRRRFQIDERHDTGSGRLRPSGKTEEGNE